jgi:hypothetical protein
LSGSAATLPTRLTACPERLALLGPSISDSKDWKRSTPRTKKTRQKPKTAIFALSQKTPTRAKEKIRIKIIKNRENLRKEADATPAKKAKQRYKKIRAGVI